jgi:hypothetical protein
MQIESEKDFTELRQQYQIWKKRFPMFVHDVNHFEQIIEKHIKNYSNYLVDYRRTHQLCYIEKAQHEIDEINRVVSMIGKIELMAMLSQ